METLTPSAVWRNDELETVPCDCCGSVETREVYRRPDGMLVVECGHCGLHYLCPRPKPELISRLYEEGYFKNASQIPGTGYTDYLSDGARQQALQTAEIRLQAVSPFWQPQGKRCLEIGCATGEFCDLLNRRGAEVKGIDLSEFAVREARKRYPHLKFETGTIEKFCAETAFDSVFGFELLEHVLSPSEFLNKCSRLLVTDGLLVMSTPNLDCGKQTGFASWSGFNSSFEHLYFFSLGSLEDLARKSEFETLQWLTGYGAGLWPQHQSPTRKDFLKSLLANVGLLDLAQRVRRRLLPPRPIYSPGGRQHNLFVVLRKSAIRS